MRPTRGERIGKILLRAARRRALDGNAHLRTLACNIAGAAACPAPPPHSREELLKRLSDIAAHDAFHASMEAVLDARILPPIACKIAANASFVADIASVVARAIAHL